MLIMILSFNSMFKFSTIIEIFDYLLLANLNVMFLCF